jgi:hypothetical protein
MNCKKWFFLSLALLLAAVLIAPQLPAQTQTTGDITGVVTDQSGAIVPQAKVSLKDNSKGSAQSSEANKEGAYRFFLLTPSSYTITASAPGLQSVSRVVDVTVGQVVTANIQMNVATSTTTVTVTEAAPLIQTDNGDISSTISQQQISETPNPGNDMSYIAQLAPGSMMNTSGGLGNFSSFGTPATSNLFTLNGMDDNDPFLNLNNSGATNLLLGANEIQEATVVTNGYSSQYGGLAGANINYVTKSGGNQFHGNAIYYWNGRALNANDWILKAQGANRGFSNANQWAGSFGGPIIKDKAFFFFNTEGLRVVLPTATSAFVPTADFETAAIANLTARGLTTSVPFYQNIFNLYNGSLPKSGNVTAIACPTYTLNGVANSNPFGVANCTQQFTSSVTNLTHEQQFSGRVDYNLSSNDRIFLRILKDHGFQASYTDPINALFNQVSDQPQWQGQLNESHVFNSTLSNQFIASFAWYAALFNNANRAATLAAFPTTVGFSDGSLSNMGGGLFGIGDANAPQGRVVTQYGFSDDITKSFGKHTFSFGGKFRRFDISDHDFGPFTSGLVTEASLLDFFDGGVVNPARNLDPNSPSGNNLAQNFTNLTDVPVALYQLAGYVQDQWRVKPNLSLTLALRLEHDASPVCVTNCVSTPVAPFVNLDHNPDIPYNQAIKTGVHQAYSAPAVLWEPRVSFAWQPFGTARSFVVRGGVGIFYDAIPGVLTDVFAGNTPNLNGFVSVNAPLTPGETNNLFAANAAANQAFVGGFANGATLADLQAAVPGFSPPAIVTADRNLHVPQYQKWNLEVQQALGGTSSLTVGYVGNHGIHEIVQDNSLNAFCGPTSRSPLCANGPFGGLPTSAPDPRFNLATQYESAGVSNFNGLNVNFQHHFTGWSSGVFSANYLWSHAFDISSNGGLTAIPFGVNGAGVVSIATPQNPNNIRGNYAPEDYDVRHNFTANYVWEVPVRRALRGHGSAMLTEGWQVSGTIFARSGLPFTVVDSAATGTLTGSGYGSIIIPQFLGGPTPNCGAAAATPTNLPGSTACLTQSEFAVGAETGFTTGLRNAFRGANFLDTDFTIVKNTKIPGWERGQLGIGFQFFNLFNHPNFALPDGNAADPNHFGRVLNMATVPTSILGAGLGGDASPRIIQLKADLRF